MSYDIPLQAIPNQQFSIIIEEKNFKITLQYRDLMLFSLEMNNKPVINSIPCFSMQPVLPYNHLREKIGGVFFFETQDENYPNYRDFGTTCFLSFITDEEITQMAEDL